MAIYTRFGSAVTSIGSEVVMYGQNAGEWVQFTYNDNGDESECRIFDLRADNGLTEIREAIDAAKVAK